MFQVLFFRGGESALFSVGEVNEPPVSTRDQKQLPLVMPRGAYDDHACCNIHYQCSGLVRMIGSPSVIATVFSK